jgi:hypothetical protein
MLHAGYEQLVSVKSAAGREQNLTDLAALPAARGETLAQPSSIPHQTSTLRSGCDATLATLEHQRGADA